MATSLTPITGTANVTNGSTTVEVVGMALSALNCADGAQVFLAGLGYFVSGGPTDTTHFELERPYEGTTGTVSCSIGQVTPEMTQRIALARAIAGFDASAQLIAANQAGLSYSYTGSTAAPISGQVALDNADPASATAINFNEVDLSQQSVADRLGQIAAGDQLTIRAIDGSARVSYIASGAPVDEGSYQQVAVTYLGAAGVLAAGAQVVVERIAKGAKGDTGANGVFSAIATQAQAQAGTDNVTGMTPLRALQAMNVFGVGGQAVLAATDLNTYQTGGSYVTPASGLTNLPPGWGQKRYTVEVNGGTSYASQTLVDTNTGAQAVRSWNGTAWSAWQIAYGPANAVGTVSQSSGMPTGAIVETGTNANGTYTRFADGTQICTMTLSVPGTSWSSAAAFGSYKELAGSETFPAAFTAAPTVSATADDANITQRSAYVTFVSASATAITDLFLASPGAAVSSSAVTVYIQAIGRWF